MMNEKAILFSIGKSTDSHGPVSLQTKLAILNESILTNNFTLYGANFQINKESLKQKGASFPITGLLYVKKHSKSQPTSIREKISYVTRIEAIEPYKKPTKPTDNNIRPERWKNDLFKTYLKLSQPIKRIENPLNPTQLVKWDGTPLKGGVQGYSLVNNPL